jgi:hypothetical protein
VVLAAGPGKSAALLPEPVLVGDADVTDPQLVRVPY